jgi:hypothetical protein
MNEELVIHTVELNQYDQVRVTKKSYEGREQYHVRLWYRKEGSDKYRPTARGVTIYNPDRVLELCDGFDKLRAMLQNGNGKM